MVCHSHKLQSSHMQIVATCFDMQPRNLRLTFRMGSSIIYVTTDFKLESTFHINHLVKRNNEHLLCGKIEPYPPTG